MSVPSVINTVRIPPQSGTVPPMAHLIMNSTTREPRRSRVGQTWRYTTTRSHRLDDALSTDIANPTISNATKLEKLPLVPLQTTLLTIQNLQVVIEPGRIKNSNFVKTSTFCNVILCLEWLCFELVISNVFY